VSQPTPSHSGREADPVRVAGSDRVLAVLTALAQHPNEATLDELSHLLDSPKPTIHRALAALRRAVFARQNGRGTYLLGDEFLWLASSYHEARPEHVRILPALERLADRFHETAHRAALTGRDVMCCAKVASALGAIKLTSVIGGLNLAHCTAVGKLLIAYELPYDTAVVKWMAKGQPLEPPTVQTKVTAKELAGELAQIRDRGYATEEQANDVGICCLAVPVHMMSAKAPAVAITVSALAYRTPLSCLVIELPCIQKTGGPMQAHAASSEAAAQASVHVAVGTTAS
jgi:IclR family acetate operon transcriptional repressor